jgi:hypothetical protein
LSRFRIELGLLQTGKLQILFIFVLSKFYFIYYRGGSIKPVTQLLLALRFYASGSMQRTVSDFTGVSTSSGCRIIKRVSEAIASLRPNYINMYENVEEMNRSAEKMYHIARFPRVIGATDCTLIKIQSPGGNDAEIYRTRKNFFGINVQTVSDKDLYIRDIVARWPGSSHDQTIFNNSSLKQKFEDGTFGSFMLVGDSGYQLKPYLMTKLQRVQTAAENLYNESQIRTRNVVERQYGVWKRRFPVLQIGMRLKIATVLNIIVATAVLHNLALIENEEIPEEWLEGIEDEENLENEGPPILENENAAQVRRLIINEHFARL